MRVLHERLLEALLGIGEEAVKRGEVHPLYARPGCGDGGGSPRRRTDGIPAGAASIEEVARISFSGGVMPQKSTDFYPKLLSGLTIHRLEK